jgi:RNA polymerase sigma factor (sigma-70 family)
MEHGQLDNDAIAASVASPAEFALIFDRHFDAIHGYLCKRVGESLADELASRCFLAAFDARARYDSSRPDARPWLFGIATNLLRNHRRQEGRQLPAYSRAAMPQETDPLHGAEARADASRLRPQLTALLAALPREESDPLLLYAWAELTYEEIGAALDLPVGTVKSRLSRVRARIREQLRLQRPISNDEVTTTVESDDG